jgi:hypothetical protein
MRTRGGIGQRLAAAFIVAAGMAIVWEIALGWVVSLVQMLLPATPGAQQDILLAFDGTPVISTHSTEVGSLTVSRRSLDGKSWPLDYQKWLTSAYFHQPYKIPGIVEIPISWSDEPGRTAGGTDGKLPPTAWYLIHDAEPVGHVYVAGFDAFSKMPVGYIGTKGFSASVPPLDEQFAVPGVENNEMFRLYISSQNLEYHRIVWDHNLWRNDVWLYLLGPTDLWKIDLRERTARSVAKFDGAMEIGQVGAMLPAYDALEPKTVTKAAEAKPPAIADADKTKESDDTSTREEDPEWQNWRSLMAVREPDRIVIFNLDGKRQDFMLPEKLLDRRFSVFLVGPNELLVDAHEQDYEFWSGGPIIRLYWMDQTGKIKREEEVKLGGWVPESPYKKAWRWAAVNPICIAWLVGVLVGAPLYLLQVNTAGTFPSAVAMAAGYAWLPLIVVILVSAVLAWLTWRQQRKYRRSATGVWAAFVFLLGVPGFLAYLIEHRRAKLEACPECGEIVPRDRDACAGCADPFRAPPRVGTEIFA